MSEDFFGDLGKSISKATQNAVGRTSTFFESTKIQALISSEQKEIDKLYQTVGEAVCSRISDTGIVELDGEIMDIVGAIRIRNEKIRELKTDLADVRGMKICPSCQEIVPAEVAFCPHCGEAMPVDEKENAVSEELSDAAPIDVPAKEDLRVLERIPDGADEIDEELVVRDLAADIDIDAEVEKMGEAMRFTTIDDVEQAAKEETGDQPEIVPSQKTGDGATAPVSAPAVSSADPGELTASTDSEIDY